MSTRNTILKALKTEMEETIKPGNTSAESYKYLTQPVEVRRGVHDSKEFDYYPAIGYVAIRDEVFVSEFNNDSVRNMVVWVYGYIDTNSYSTSTTDYDPIHDLMEDVEKFMLHDFTYNVHLGDVEFMEGGVSHPISMFVYEMNILYENQI